MKNSQMQGGTKNALENFRVFQMLLLPLVTESIGDRDCIFMKFMSTKDRKSKKGIGHNICWFTLNTCNIIVLPSFVRCLLSATLTAVSPTCLIHSLVVIAVVVLCCYSALMVLFEKNS
uniref:Uncharacterized protein n=1 Tax=Glossina brevipalpis TaxID=37001 RepID=A0A1A9WXA6_9MUSC